MTALQKTQTTQKSGLIERLKVRPALRDGEEVSHLIRRLGVERTEAATEIARLREALTAIATISEDHTKFSGYRMQLMAETARAALEVKSND